MAGTSEVAKGFSLDEKIFGTTELALSASTDANVLTAIEKNAEFPDGDIAIGHISFSADTGSVGVKPTALPTGTSVTFDISASAESGAGVYAKSADAIKTLGLTNPPALNLADPADHRYLILDWGYTASAAESASSPVGMLGSVTFGVNAKTDSAFAVLHRFAENAGAKDVLAAAIESWRLPRHVAYDGHDVNIRPETWLIAETDGSLGLTLGANLGWDLNFARNLKLLGVTHDLSAKVDASLKATFGFNVAGSYVLVVGREDDTSTVRLRLYKQSSKGINFGLNLCVGVQGADPKLPATFHDFIQSVFGQHGLQVLNDLEQWSNPSTDLGQKLAGLADQDVLNLLKATTIGIDLTNDFNKAKQVVTDALNTWSSLPDKLSSMLWTYLGNLGGAGVSADFQAFLTDLANPTQAGNALSAALKNAAFGDTPQGQFLEAVADQGLLALENNLPSVCALASKVLNILNGNVLAKLQSFINQKLDLDQIRNALSDADFGKVEQWLQTRLGNFLDKQLGLDDLKDIQKAIQTLDTKAQSFYQIGIQALTKHYRASFAATYQKTAVGTALIDVNFDLSQPEAAALFNQVVAQNNLDHLLTTNTNGVTLNEATLSHEIKRNVTVQMNMPWFDFSRAHVNDAVASLTAEEQGGHLLVYQVNAKDSVTVADRTASQLSVLASLKLDPGQPPRLDSTGSIAYEMLEVKSGMRPLDLEVRTTGFIHEYLTGLFSGGDASIRTFFTDLDNAISTATHNSSNQLGDMAISMQLSLRAAVLGGWFEKRNDSRLLADQMTLSRALQVAWKAMLPMLYFQDLNLYRPNESVAALLVWSSIPVSTSIDSNDGTLKFNTDKAAFWNWPDVDLRRAVARDPHTMATLGARLSSIQTELHEAGKPSAGFFDVSRAGDFVEDALNATGDKNLQSLLFTESQLVDGATDALKKISEALSNLATAPGQAIAALSQFAANLTNTFNNRVSSIYSGVSGRIVGPMLLVESSAALGSVGTNPAALLTMYALKPNHSFALGTFVDGAMPTRADVALTQTLVSLQ